MGHRDWTASGPIVYHGVKTENEKFELSQNMWRQFKPCGERCIWSVSWGLGDLFSGPRLWAGGSIKNRSGTKPHSPRGCGHAWAQIMGTGGCLPKTGSNKDPLGAVVAVGPRNGTFRCLVIIKIFNITYYYNKFVQRSTVSQHIFLNFLGTNDESCWGRGENRRYANDKKIEIGRPVRRSRPTYTCKTIETNIYMWEDQTDIYMWEDRDRYIHMRRSIPTYIHVRS